MKACIGNHLCISSHCLGLRARPMNASLCWESLLRSIAGVTRQRVATRRRMRRRRMRRRRRRRRRKHSPRQITQKQLVDSRTGARKSGICSMSSWFCLQGFWNGCLEDYCMSSGNCCRGFIARQTIFTDMHAALGPD